MLRFIWPPEALAPAVFEAMQGLAARPLCDLSDLRHRGELARLAGLTWLSESTVPLEYYIDSAGLLEPQFQSLFAANADARLWLTAASFSPELIRQAQQLAAGRVGWVVVSVDEIETILSVSGVEPCFVLKGNEAGGRVGSDSLLSLYTSVTTRFAQVNQQLELHVWGGIATPEAAAAFLATGAAGVVFESVHWLTDLPGIAEACQKKIEQLRPDHTRLIGLQRRQPCRVFDKGNSRAAKAAAQYAYADENPQAWSDYLQQHLVLPLHSRWGPDQLIPLGVEATFAQAFVRRFGPDFKQALRLFQCSVQNLLDHSRQITARFADSEVAGAWGTRFPIIQGGMSWISDSPDFAAVVAQAGALPTLALGMLDAGQLQQKFGQIATQLSGLPYAVNIITLAENPQREAQLNWILSHRPRFAVIAAGEPAQGKTLLAAGIELIYIAPNEELLRLALESGYRYVICEGCESGGHIGGHSTLMLAQLAIELKQRRPELFAGRRLILAGGICNRKTAQMAAMLGADAIQMGTAYLATTEIVASGALSPVYQQQILRAGYAATVVTGEAVGLRVRALRNEKTAAILQLEREYAVNRAEDQDFRYKLEQLATGSLLLAARQIDAHSGRSVDAATAVAGGQFMSGTCAAVLSQTRTLAELHQAIIGVDQQIQPPASAAERIAITGMSQVNSLGNSPAEIWRASIELRSGVTAVPQEKWNHDRYVDPRPMVSGKTYCRVAAFQQLQVNRRDIDVSPQDFKNMTTATKLALWTARQAVDDAGILQSDIDRQKIGVILSQNATEMTPISGDLAVRDAIPDILAAIRRVIDVSPEQATALATEIAAGRKIQDDTSLLGRLSSMVPGFVCNKFGFTGPSYSVLAACASSLVALHSAVQLMRNGVLDAALVGGAEEPLSALHFLEFSVLGALAGITGQIRPPEEMSRPFDQDRDGFVMGEGAGMIMLERESVARRRGARIYGYITGVGASNTETGMVESSRHSQIRAIKQSFAGLPYGPAEVDLVECHATATRQGDLEEIQALQSIYPADKQTVLAGFKSQIGHTLGAAGINSLIRGIMAMNAGTYPATLNCTCPDPAVNWQQSGFAILNKPAAWTSRPGRPRRVQVDAFGFGGSNFVVQLEQVETAGLPNVATHFTASTLGLPGVQLFQRTLAGNNYKLAIMADSAPTAEQLLESSGMLQNVSALTEKRRRSLARQGVHISLPDPAPRRAALVFSGQGAQYVGMGKELYAELPEIRDLLTQASEFFGFDIPALLFESGEEKLQDTRWQQPAIFALEVAIARSLLSLGLQPVALAGHSLGQFAALCIAGVFSFADGCKIVNQRALCMEQTGRLSADAGAMVAVHAGQERVAPYLERTSGVFVLNSNSPLQTVIGGDTAATLKLADELSLQGLRSTRLPVAMAFHSPLFRTVAAEFAAFLQTIPFLPPTIPVLSNHTGAAFPGEASEIRRLLAEHLYSPVDWLQNVRSLHTDYAVALFVEAGPREALGNMIRDILPGTDCLPTCLPSIELAALQNAVAQLFVNGCLAQSVERTDLPQPAAKTVETLVHGASASLPPSRVIAPDRDCPVDEATLAGVMAVIVQTTGYEPEEVAADMDLRDDLAIRSSRLPVIADALETRFGITLDLQDFAGVRTVRDIAGRIAAIRQSCGPEAASRNRKAAQQAAIELAATADPVAASQPLRRITFAQELSPVAAPAYLKLSPLDKIGIICREDDWREAAAAAAVFRRDHGAVLTRVESPEQAGDGLACLLLWIGDQSGGAATAASRLTECLLQIQAFCTQANARAVLLLQRAENRAAGRLVAAGLEGILLSLAWEYRSILFRSIQFAEGRLTDSLIRRALDQNLQPLILFSRPEGVFVEIGKEAPLTATAGSSWQLGPADVVVISGGGAGILQEWVRALIPFGCRLVLLGRSELSSAAGQARSKEITDLLAELATVGITARYLSCDVADADQCEQALATVQNEFGRISGLIHGAGVLRDNYLPQITAEDFTAVVNVKLQGADNLFQAAQGRGLRWFAAVSSVAAVNGNAGQAAYAAANRAMTAYLDLLQRQYPQIRCQALLLGPVEGGGMADTEELRALMRWSGYSYIHAREAAQLFCQEMARCDPAAGPVLLVRETPLVATASVLRRATDDPDDNVENRSINATMPLLDAVTFDWRNRSLVATRSVQAARDLWLPEHRPLPMLKQPIVSGVMMVEMFVEAARALYPYLSLQGLRQVKFIDRIECPPAQPRLSRIDCHVAALQAGGVDCALKLRTQELSPTGRQLDRWPINAEAIVILGAAGRQNTAPIEGLPFAVDAARRKTVNRPTLLKMYKRFTALTGRYQLLQKISSGGIGLVEAEFVLPQQVDFADRRSNDYQTSPYLLEAMFQTVVFQTLLEQAAEVTTIALPYAVSELEYHQAGPAKGRLRLQARRRGEDAVGVIWDAAVYDATGQPIQSARGLEMRWLSL